MTSFLLNITAQAATGSIRTLQWAEREWLVVPVVALVEGTIQGANAVAPELALAEEFGRHVEGWNGRPLVMGHPQVNDTFVSANSPEILDTWAFGHIFNARVENSKLKMDAFIDVGRAMTLAGDFQEAVERIQAGNLVEVSTGLFVDLEESSGKYGDEAFSGIWRNVTPDHLAILAKGVVGACSVEDGCGIPRINFRVQQDCSCGGTCGGCGDDDMPKTPNPKGPLVLDKSTRVNADDPSPAFARAKDSIQKLLANAAPSGMTVADIRQILYRALNAHDDIKAMGGVWEILALTAEEVVFESWDTAQVFAAKFSITESGDADISEIGEATVLQQVVRKVPVADDLSANSSSDIPDNGSATSDPPIIEGVKTMAGDKTKLKAAEGTPPAENVDPDASAELETGTAEAVETETVVNNAAPKEKAKVTPAKAITVESYLQEAPDEVRSVLQEGMRLQKARRAELIDTIKTNKANKLDDATLTGMDTRVLEGIASLVKPEANYTGANGGSAVSVQSGGDDTPAPMNVFSLQKKEA